MTSASIALAPLDDSVDVYLARVTRPRYTLYLICLAAFFAALAGLPVIQIDITERGVGLLRPAVEKLDVRARTSGILTSVALTEGRAVEAGTVLAVVDRRSGPDRARFLESQMKDRAAEIATLQVLTTEAMNDGMIAAERLPALQRRQEYAQYRAEREHARVNEERTSRELARATQMHDQRLLADNDYEEALYRQREARTATSALVDKYVGEWQTDLAALTRDVATSRAELEQIASESALDTIVAPSAGTVGELTSVAPGSYVQMGDRLAVISPAATMLAEVRVSTSDVGLLRRGLPVRMQIDAFDYREWGVVSGRVESIGDDFVAADGHLFFLVRCRLDAETLRLKTGVVGHLKKGMTLRASFLVGRRSLFRLLYESVSDWLDTEAASGTIA